MKRKCCLIEPFEKNDSFEKKIRQLSKESNSTMYKNSNWYCYLLTAEKTCLKEDKIKKVHYKFEDDKEMVEEYNTDTQVLLRRAWKIKSKIGGEAKWEVEIGDPIPDMTPNIDSADIMEAKDQVSITKLVF